MYKNYNTNNILFAVGKCHKVFFRTTFDNKKTFCKTEAMEVKMSAMDIFFEPKKRNGSGQADFFSSIGRLQNYYINSVHQLEHANQKFFPPCSKKNEQKKNTNQNIVQLVMGIKNLAVQSSKSH